MKRTLPLLLLLVASLCAAQTTNGRSSGLNAAQLKKLRATKLRFLVPTRVPSGYKVVRLELETNKDPRLVHMSIVYKRGSSEIAVQQSSDGLGDLIFGEDPDKGTHPGVYTWWSPILKGKQGVEYQVEKGKTRWHVQWIELPGKGYPRYVSAYGQNSGGRTGVEFMEGLRWLR